MPIRFLMDENFDNRILRGLLRRLPQLDIIRVQDVGLMNTDDEIILDWAATENRIVLTHDAATMADFAYERIANSLAMPGVFEVSKKMPIGEAVEELFLIAQCSFENEWNDQVRFLPLR
jgi:uncharacterized protein (DUF4213/DUF364 family)